MQTITIGRAPDNVMVVSSPDVSGHHACVTVYDDGRVTIKDVGSTNGTFVNGVRVAGETPVRPGDRVLLGKTPADLNRFFPVGDPRPPVSNGKSTMHKGTIVGGGGGMDAAGGITIGRSSDNVVVMPQGEVSSHHAVLRQSPSGEVTLMDSGSTNGTYVNGSRISSVVLKRGDKVLLANKYPLDWEKYVSGPITGGKTKKTGLIAGIAAGIAAVLIIGLCAIFLPGYGGKMSESAIYDKYNSSVVLVIHQFTYALHIEGVDDEAVRELLYIKAGVNTNYFTIKNGSLVPNQFDTITGTGFFVSQDGMLVTNLHVAHPWEFETGAEKLNTIEQIFRDFFVSIGLPSYVTQVKVEGMTVAMGVIPNGLPISGANLTACREYKVSDMKERDVAILQTDTRTLPNKVEAYIDLAKADISDKALAPGNKIYTIGFPLGVSQANVTLSDMALHNQIQAGSVTQIRDENSFGHNCASAGGASGSPILNDRGRLVGVLNAGMPGTQGLNMGIKAKHVVDLLNK